MTARSCPREPEVLRAVARGWEGTGDGTIAAHASTCPRCAEVRTAGELLRASVRRDVEGARVPSAAAMWWRLERRLRAERALRAQRIAMTVQAVVLACAAGVGVAVAQIAAPWLPQSGIAALRQSDVMDAVLASLSSAVSTWAWPVAMLVAAWIVLVPAALYLGLAEE